MIEPIVSITQLELDFISQPFRRFSWYISSYLKSWEVYNFVYLHNPFSSILAFRCQFTIENFHYCAVFIFPCSERSKKVKPNIFVYFIQHLPNFPGQEGQFLCSFTKENGQLKSLLSGRLHMSNWFFSAIMDGSGLCIPIRLKNAWGRNLLQIRGARSSQGKKCCDDQSRCSKIKSSYFLRPRFCGHIFLKTTSYASDFTSEFSWQNNFFFVTHLGLHFLPPLSILLK